MRGHCDQCGVGAYLSRGKPEPCACGGTVRAKSQTSSEVVRAEGAQLKAATGSDKADWWKADAVTAAGTSEGARKGWEHRGKILKQTAFDLFNKHVGSGSSEHMANKLSEINNPTHEHLHNIVSKEWGPNITSEIKDTFSKHFNMSAKDYQEYLNASSIHATGTSEGAKKGWEHRERVQIALKHSWNAGEMTKRATKSGDSLAHSLATNENRKAAESNRLAAKQVQDFPDAVAEFETAAKFHDMVAMAHNEAAMFARYKSEPSKATDPTSTDIVHCRASSASGPTLASDKLWQPSERVEFMWMPAGVSTITAGFRKGSIELTVRCDETTASAVQASLDAWREERPKQEPFGCVEHREHEASVRVSAAGGFSWRNDGVYLAAEPTTLGAQNVNGRVHRSWSPSFTTDADYASATEDGGVLRFPPGVRGSRQNPAQITGVDFCVGTLTNKPAFREMSPVKSSEGTLVTLADGTQTLYRPGEAGEPVTASGTSEGAKKGWEKKHAGGIGSENGVILADVTGGTHYGTSVVKIPGKHGGDSVFHNIVHKNPGKAVMEAHAHLSSEGAGGIESVSNPYPKGRTSWGLSATSGDGSVHHFKFMHSKVDRNKLEASDATTSTTLHASCSAAFYQDVPDGTDAELKSYEEMVESGHNHAEAVECVRMDRNKAKREVPTLASIQERQSNAVAAANRIAEERGVAKLTAEDVYEKFSVNAEPRKQEPDATPEAILERIYARAGANR